MYKMIIIMYSYLKKKRKTKNKNWKKKKQETNIRWNRKEKNQFQIYTNIYTKFMSITFNRTTK